MQIRTTLTHTNTQTQTQILLDFNAKRDLKISIGLTGVQKCILRDLKIDPNFFSKQIPGIPFKLERGVIDEIVIEGDAAFT